MAVTFWNFTVFWQKGKTKSQKGFRANSYIWRSYRGKTWVFYVINVNFRIMTLLNKKGSSLSKIKIFYSDDFDMLLKVYSHWVMILKSSFSYCNNILDFWKLGSLVLSPCLSFFQTYCSSYCLIKWETRSFLKYSMM